MKLTITVVDGTAVEILAVIRQMFNGQVNTVSMVNTATVNATTGVRPLHSRLPKDKVGKVSLADAVRQAVAEGPATTDEIIKRVLKSLPKLDKNSVYAAVYNMSKQKWIQKDGDNWVTSIRQ